MKDWRVPSFKLLVKMLETSLDKSTSCQGRGLGIRKVVKRTKMRIKIIKQKTSDSIRRESQ